MGNSHGATSKYFETFPTGETVHGQVLAPELRGRVSGSFDLPEELPQTLNAQRAVSSQVNEVFSHFPCDGGSHDGPCHAPKPLQSQSEKSEVGTVVSSPSGEVPVAFTSLEDALAHSKMVMDAFYKIF